MKSFFNQQKARCTAAAMLFVWLLALGTGIANACLVQVDHARHGHLSHHDTVLTALPVTALDAIHASAKVHPGAIDHNTSPGTVICQNFCAAEQTGMVKQQTDAPVHLDDALVLVSMWWVAPTSTDRAFQMPALGVPARIEPPVFIRFLRLTI